MVRNEYINRYKRGIMFQHRVFGMVLDWTVIIYIGIPIMIALGVIHYQLWEEPPGWVSRIPVDWSGLSLYAVIVCFSMRTFIEQADELFVIQRVKFYNALIQWGKYIAIIKSGLEIGVVILYLLPIFLNGYHLSVLSILVIYFYVFLWSLFQKLISRWFVLRGIIWRKRLVSIVSFVVYGTGLYGLFYSPLIFIGIILIISLTVLLLLKSEKKPLRFFHAESERERNEKWKWASLIMMQSGEFEGIQKTRKFPLLIKNSRPIFLESTPKKVLTEMYWKWLIRKGKQIKFYLYFISFAFYAMVILPFKIKFYCLLFIIAAGYFIQEGMWKAFITHPFARNMGNINGISIMKAKRLAYMVTWLIPFGVLTLLTFVLFLKD